MDVQNVLIQVGDWSRPRMLHSCPKHIIFQVTLGCDECEACRTRAILVRERVLASGKNFEGFPTPVGLILVLPPVADGVNPVSYLSELLALPVSRVN